MDNINNDNIHNIHNSDSSPVNIVIDNSEDKKLRLLKTKIYNLQDTIRNTIIAIQRYKKYGIISSNDVKLCIDYLKKCFKTLEQSNTFLINSLLDKCIDCIQSVNKDLATVFRLYGTMYLQDILAVCFGTDYIKNITQHAQEINDIVLFKSKLDIINKYVHPINYKIIPWKKDKKDKKDNVPVNKNIIRKNRIVEDFTIVEDANTLECFDLSRTSNEFQLKVYGIKIAFHHYQQKKTIIICGMVEDILLDCMPFYYVNRRIESFLSNKPKEVDFDSSHFSRYVNTITLKDLLIYSNDELYNRFVGYLNHNNLIKKKLISQVVKEFITSELYLQRNFLITLLINDDDYEIQYLAYLLYDLLTNDMNGNVDTAEQSLLYDSLPIYIREYFHEAIKKTSQYAQNLNKYDEQKIPIEQQICLLKANDNVKAKAMQKLKEVKAKNEDTGTKARQYLEGLLRIPFGIYKNEPILNVVDQCLVSFKTLIDNINTPLHKFTLTNVPVKSNYTTMEIQKYCKTIENNLNSNITYDIIDKINSYLDKCKRKEVKHVVITINTFIKNNCLKIPKILHSGKKTAYMIDCINTVLPNLNNKNHLIEICKVCNIPYLQPDVITQTVYTINDNVKQIKSYIDDVSLLLDDAVHGHTKAKRQIERIIGQWINGEKTGYCFGFEGPPGVGKCFAKDTPIMLFNCNIKLVQDITTEDVLMGDDSTPRKVISLGRGREKMYKIIQTSSDPYIVNESHILSLKVNIPVKHTILIMGKKYKHQDTVDISIREYLNLPDIIKSQLKGYKVSIHFDEKSVPFDPYLLGQYLIKHQHEQFGIVPDEYTDLVKYINDILYNTNDNDKYLLNIYKQNSSQVRLNILYGVIDSQPNEPITNKDYIEIVIKNDKLKDFVVWLLGSLALKYSVFTEHNNHTIHIFEDQLITYKVTYKEKHYKETVNNNIPIYRYIESDITVIELDEDEYYGFQIDGNSRFLLGDFTVTHNTSLAKKGIANCLKDKDGISRPFSFIAIGGSSNGSTLDGHNYTYVGSTWGKIVDILIETKCMNPIIFIDELDKVSRTENGKEIIGILTHLIDPTQNDCFQDKYFNGIDLDLSKALFIFSYNDIESIDKILLDRIHRIKFDHLSLSDKLIISKKYLLPEIYTKMGLNNAIVITDEILQFIIDEYTLEPGVRKLKEILFEIVGEINLSILKNEKEYELPIVVTMNDIKYNYLKERHGIKLNKIHPVPAKGVINGLWANTLGRGGILPIEVSFFPSNTFLELKLTGMQGDVMKESMNVAKTLAWNLFVEYNSDKVNDLVKLMESTKLQGIHIHVPEGATPKDGPSAGTAITVSIYSLLTNKKINNTIAITGEICLQGNVTEIGGLDLKLHGGIKAGIKTFVFPTQNNKHYHDFITKCSEKNELNLLNDIKFIQVNTIKELFDLNILYID
jgi:ATP-dependent Lon protease